MDETKRLRLTATAAFGLEAVVKREAASRGFTGIKVSDGRVDFESDLRGIARANLWFRSADRVLLLAGEFKALTFDELFEGTKAIGWEEWITEDGKFTVTGKSVRSQLHSVPDCQSIVKKAVVEKLKQKYNRSWFDETGPEYKIQVSLLRDVAALTIDTTGPGLHRRGYRKRSVIAPIKETLAAGLVSLTYWNRDRILLDPMCGSGTIPIEAALVAKNIAPGLSRGFVSEGWPQMPEAIWKEERERAASLINRECEPSIYGSDIDADSVAIAKRNAGLAGVEGCVVFEAKALEDARLPGGYGIAICNPPYAERIGSVSEAEVLYGQMRKVFGSDRTWSLNVITPDEFFESAYGRKADSKRKLFNGMIKTDYYMYDGAKPPKA